MKISKLQLRKIIEEEKNLALSEGGCGCGGSTVPTEQLSDYEEDYTNMPGDYGHDDHSIDQFMSKEESLKAVVAIAMSTSCPVTRETLLDAVRELM